MCEISNAAYASVVFTDNAAAHETCIKSVLPGCKVGQDLKHLINRVLENCSKNHPLYAQFCKNFHGALVGCSKVPAQSRNGKVYYVPEPLKEPETIITCGDAMIKHFKSLPSGPTLFTNSFDTTWNYQKTQIRRYIFEVYVNGKTHIYFKSSQ